MAESIGKRIAYLRQKNGWTQQSLADRLAMSRVAISHIEMDLLIPSERSITLMAGVFKLSPTELVDGTNYPKAKVERLPDLTTIFTDLELRFEIFKNDLEWLNRLDKSGLKQDMILQLINQWSPILENLSTKVIDEHESDILKEMRRLLKIIRDQANNYLA